MKRNCSLRRNEHIPERAMFPAIDAHNHLWGTFHPQQIVKVMNAVGVVCFCNVTANAKIVFSDDGYVEPTEIEEFFKKGVQQNPGKFYCFTMATFARSTHALLFEDPQIFVDQTIELLRKHVKMGARGLKILNDLGLKHRDASGRLIHVDDPNLWEIWAEAGRLGVPVLIHQADPSDFFEPVTPANEHYEVLKKYPDWSLAGPGFPKKEELLERCENLVKQHPDTTFILPHVASNPEDLGYVSKLLDNNANVYIDFSARLDELGRQPYTARGFFVKHQDRIIFGTDMPADTRYSIDMYRSYFRFLETFDESFYVPDYDGTFENSRWPICGIGLPENVLRKIYYKNILRIVPGLREELESVLPDEQTEDISIVKEKAGFGL